jgi:hypothetical protein
MNQVDAFIIRPGEVREIVDVDGIKHFIRVSRYKDHDHMQKPIYHPLKNAEDPNQLVVTIEATKDALPSSYPPVYASCVTDSWTALRGSTAFHCEYDSQNGDEKIICCVEANLFANLKINVEENPGA